MAMAQMLAGGDKSFLESWNELLNEIKRDRASRNSETDEIDDTLKEAVLGEMVDDGEDAEEGWIVEDSDDEAIYPQ